MRPRITVVPGFVALAILCGSFSCFPRACAQSPNPPSNPGQTDQLSEAGALDEQAARLDQQGQTAEAIEALKRALEIRERLFGQGNLQIAETSEILGVLYMRTGAYVEAEALLVRALAIRDRVLGANHPDTLTSLSLLVGLYISTGANAKAEPVLIRELAARERILGADHPDTATSMNYLGAVYRSMGKFSKAEPLLARALAIRIKVLGEEHPDTASSLNNLAAVYISMGAYTKAEPLCLRAIAIYEKVVGPETQETANSLQNLAALYRLTGEYAKAETLNVRALAISKKVSGPAHPRTLESMNNLAVLYTVTGAYAQAETLLLDAITLSIAASKKGPQAQPATAIHWTMHDLGALYESMGAYDKAELVYVRALAFAEQALGPDHPDTAISLYSLAGRYVLTGRYAKAEPLLVRALNLKEKSLGPEHPEVAAIINTLAILYEWTGAYAKAESLFLRAIAINEKVLGAEHLTTSASLENMAELRWATGDAASALSLLLRARSITEANLSRLLLLGSEQRRRQYLSTLSIGAPISFSLANATPASHALGAAAVLQLKGRGLDASSESISRLHRHLDAPARALLRELAQVASQRSSLSLEGPGTIALDAFRKRMGDFAVKQERLERELSSRSSAFAQAIQPITLERVQQAIPATDVLIEWIRFAPFNPKVRQPGHRSEAARYAAYLITRDKSPIVVDLGEASAIELAVANVQSVLRRPGIDVHPKEARDLFNRIIQPLLEPLAQLQPTPSRLFLSPDGVLNLVPFAALVDDQGSYFGQRFELNYLTSGRDLIRINAAQAERPREPITVIAAPNYGQNVSQATAPGLGTIDSGRSVDFNRSGMQFNPLPGTAGEARLLKQLFKLADSQVATGNAASEARVKSLRGPRILHIATHGFFLPDRPLPEQGTSFDRGRVEFTGLEAVPRVIGENPMLRSGLAFSGANSRVSAKGEDGILTAAEAAQLDLHGTLLVVLSACETGSGDVADSEGVYGLRRALVLAGAQSQLVSLWKVNDAATEKLMGEYYRRLARGEGRSEALKSAQRVMQERAATAHPFFWAAFVPIGDWRAMHP